MKRTLTATPMSMAMNPSDADITQGPEGLAAQYIQSCSEGHAPDLDLWATRLEDGSEQASFRRMVSDAQLVGSLLPRQVGIGIVLGGRYRIEKEIGAGGMGKVFEATDLQLDRSVAVKVLAAMGRSSFDPLELFRKESRLLASLRHPNIVAIHEAATDGDVSYLVMELVNGRSLADIINTVRDQVSPDEDGRRCAPPDGLALARALDIPAPEGRTSLLDERSWWRTIARIMVDLASTIEATHAKGIIHRDLKPSNILLRGTCAPVVLDFGLAGSLEAGESGDVTKGFVGSAAYLAPEQVRRRAVGADTRTDIYQLGLVLFELLTLERAFPDEGIDGLLERISKGRFERPRTLDHAIPSELEAICLMAMELDPSRRYASGKQLHEDLERYLGGQELPLAARGGTVADMARRGRYFARRHRGRVQIAGASLLILATAFFAPRFFPDTVEVEVPMLVATGTGFEPYRYDGEDYSPIGAGHGDPANLSDLLGVHIETDEPVFLYVLSVFGQRDPITWVRPMEPDIIKEQSIDGEEATYVLGERAVKNWGLRLDPEPGGTHVACTRIDEVSQDIPYEGLWIIASAGPQPHLARWMSALEDEAFAATGDVKAVSYERARELFADANLGPRVRGSSPRLTQAEMDKILSHLDAEAVFKEAEWPFDNAQNFQFFFRIDQGLEADGSDG